MKKYKPGLPGRTQLVTTKAECKCRMCDSYQPKGASMIRVGWSSSKWIQANICLDCIGQVQQYLLVVEATKQ